MKAVVLPVLLALCTGASAADIPRGPEIVVDLGTGAVLAGSDENVPWQPASLTKLMTLYVVLEEIAAGRISFTDPVTISPTSALEPPSSSGLEVGDRIRMDDALRLLVVRSANDVATAVAETALGTRELFVARMNETAATLDMNSTRFANPHGLFDPDQRTTARDMAVLGRALAAIPAARSILDLETVAVDGRTFSTGNGIVGRLPEADGMKTGYICASGYNVVSTTTSGGRQTLAVVLGYPSAASRDARAMTLLADALSRPAVLYDIDDRIYPEGGPTRDLTDVVCGSDRRLRPGLREPNPEEVAVFKAMPRQLDEPVVIQKYQSPALQTVAGTLPRF